MPLENSTTIKGLDARWPDGDDGIHEGDDHLRLIKRVLKAVFAGSDGDGLDAPITVSAAEINHLTGVKSNVQSQIDAITSATGLIAPKGTIMAFYQAAAPAGWTIVDLKNRKYMTVVSNTGGGIFVPTVGTATTGFDDPTNADFSHDHVINPFSLQSTNMPKHTHTIKRGAGNSTGNVYTQGLATTPLSVSGGSLGYIESNGQDVPKALSPTMQSKTLTWKPLYVTAILAKKD